AIMSHDRYFLDKTVWIDYEESRHHAKKFSASYSFLVDKKAHHYRQEENPFEKQQSEIGHTELFILEHIVRRTTTQQAESRRKQLEKTVRLERPKGDEASATFSFEVKKHSGKDVLRTVDLAFGYPEENYLFSDVTLHITRGERTAL